YIYFLHIFEVVKYENFMLLKFTVENFRSLRDRIELDMTKSALKGHTGNYFKAREKKLLATSVIYGANASGKSGFLKAFRALEYLVIHSADFKPEKDLKPYEPFLLDEDNQDQPVRFEIDFISNGNHYEYL